LSKANNSSLIDAELARGKIVQRLLPKFIRIPVPLVKLEFSAFVRDISFEVKSWKSLLPYKVGTVRGFFVVQENLKEIEIIYGRDAEQVMKMLEYGRVQVVVIPKLVGESSLAKFGMKNIRILEPPIETVAFYHYLNVRHHSLVPKLTKALSASTGEVPEK
jgi:polar amino acid transport system substrate-binding protein